MKIAYLLGSLNRGGTETLLLDVFRAGNSGGFDYIGIHRKGGSYEDDFHATGVKMVRCTPVKFSKLLYLWRLRRILLNEKVTIVHAQQAIDCIYARLATIGTRIKVVETFHGYDFGAGRVGQWLNKLSIHWADAVCFVSKSQQDYYIKKYNLQKEINKLYMVYNGVDFSKLDCEYPIPDIFPKIDSATAENLPNHAEKKRRIRLAMVGNFVRVRAQNILCRSIQALREQGVNNFDFYFVGRRNEQEPWRYDDCVNYCRQHGLDNVYFVGGRSDVPAILKNIDGFVYSTDHDTFGIAVVEAMAVGIPVVVNDWEVMQEITHNGDWAMLYKSGDIKACACAINELLTNLFSWKQRALIIAAEIKREYSIDKHLEILRQVYIKVVNEH